MKKSLFALAALATFAGIAHAESSSVTLYGIVDAAVVTQNNSLSIATSLPNQIYPYQAQSASTQGSVLGIVGGGLSDSRWGIKGEEDLGGGTKAIFNLESGFNLPTGSLNNAAATLSGGNTTVNANSSLNGQLFGRLAYVGLMNDTYGKVTFGRVNAPMKDAIGSYDPVSSDTFSPFGESGTIGGGGGVSEDSRLDNAVKWEKSILNNIKLSAAYKFGNLAGYNANGYDFGVAYETDRFGISFDTNHFNNAIKATSNTAANTVSATAYDTSAYVLATKFKVTNDLQVSGGYERYTLSAASNNLSGIVTSYYGYTIGTLTTYAGSDQNANIYFIGAKYQATPKLNLSAGYYNTQILSYDTTGAGQIVTYSAVADYALSKRTDVYAAATTNSFSGDLYASKLSQITAFGLGIRHRF